jgi:hypothetical protein
MAETKEYVLFICKDDDPNLDDEALLAFKLDGNRFLKLAEEKDIGAVYRYEHHHFANAVDSLLILKGMAFDDNWQKEDTYVLYRTPDGAITTWEY